MPKYRHRAPEARRPLDRLHQTKGRPHPSHHTIKARDPGEYVYFKGCNISVSKEDLTYTWHHKRLPTGEIVSFQNGTMWIVGAVQPCWTNRHRLLADGDILNTTSYKTYLDYEYGKYLDRWTNDKMAELSDLGRRVTPAEKLVLLEIMRSNDRARYKVETAFLERFDSSIVWY